MIRLVAKKRKASGERDTVTILCEERTRVFRAWDHGILPHELVHYAVEAALGLRGFVRLVAAGRTPEEILAAQDAEALAAEALTNALQYELWGLVEPSNAGLRTRLEEGVERDGASRLRIGDARIDEVRAFLADLSRRWEALAPGARLELELSEEGHDPDRSADA